MNNKLLKLGLWILFILLLIGTWKAYDYWQYMQSDAYKLAMEYREQYRSAAQEMQNREKALQETNDMLKADTYGGKTPEETMAMFVEALKAKDAALASKYYMPWLQSDAEKDTLDWIENYPDGLQKFIDAYDTGIVSKKARVIGIGFKIFDSESDKYPYIIEMELNKVNNIWKITDF